MHFLLLGMEKRGLIFYRKARPTGSMRSTLGTMEGFLHPEIEHVREEQGQREVVVEKSDVEDGRE
jgi:hypothetical protein